VQIATWHDWLDQHIPYYERDKQCKKYVDDLPAAVLIVDPIDRNRRVNRGGFVWSTWEAIDQDIQSFDFRTEAVFLDNDTHQRWYWAFWSQNDALAAVIRLS
jgi:hypothetical protein